MFGDNLCEVLIVDDEEVSRTGLRLVLQQFDDVNVVGERKNGIEAVIFCRENGPACVLMDITMPGMDGIRATREIKAINNRIKVVMLTSRADEDSIFGAFAAGADGYCLKDASAQQLYLAIKTVCTSQAMWLHPAIADRVIRNIQHLAQPEETPSNPLSERELEVLRLVVEGLSNQEIADRLFVTIDTVKTHMRHIMEKLEVADRTQAAVKALRAGILPLE